MHFGKGRAQDFRKINDKTIRLLSSLPKHLSRSRDLRKSGGLLARSVVPKTPPGIHVRINQWKSFRISLPGKKLKALMGLWGVNDRSPTALISNSRPSWHCRYFFFSHVFSKNSSGGQVLCGKHVAWTFGSQTKQFWCWRVCKLADIAGPMTVCSKCYQTDNKLLQSD